MFSLDTITRYKFELILYSLKNHSFGSQEFYDQLVHLTKIANLDLSIPLDYSFIVYDTILQCTEIDKNVRTMILLGYIQPDYVISEKGTSFIASLSKESQSIIEIYNEKFKNEICTFNTCLMIEHPTYMNCANCKTFDCQSKNISLIQILKDSTLSLRFKSFSSS